MIPVTLKSANNTATSFAVPLTAARSIPMIDACRFLETNGEILGTVV